MNLKTNEKDIIAKEGYPIILGGVLSSLAFYNTKLKPLSYVLGSIGLFSIYFFRNPNRKVPSLKNGLVSSADGKIVYVGEAYERYFLKKYVKRISVFMSLLDVHVNRSPVDGSVVGKVYNKGKFIAANKEKASLENEQCAIHIKTKDGRDIVLVQIAGLIARRIETYPKVGDEVKKGEILGMIRFGSRVDVYVDGDFEETVRLNEKVKAGETILGLLK